MEIQFQENAISYLQTILRQTQKQEQTQQIRLSDTMPDIGRVLGCWGQVLVKAKEWRSGCVGVTGGVIAWVLYQPEGDGIPCCVDTWIPFQLKWDTDATDRDGMMDVRTSLCHIDARMLSDRKLIIRADICAEMHAVVTVDAMAYMPIELPDEIQVLQRTYPMKLPKEAGEKQFDIEQQLDIPSDGARINKLIHYIAQPMISENKIVADKLVLRGNAAIYVLYMDEFGKIHSCNWNIPFSQYTQLDSEFYQNPEVRISIALTQLEMEIVQPDALELKLGFAAQYFVWSMHNVTIVEDLYSPIRELKLQTEQLCVPSVLQTKNQTIKVDAPEPDGKILDVSFQMDLPRVDHSGDNVDIDLDGILQVLYEDVEGNTQLATEHWQKKISTTVSESADYWITLNQNYTEDQGEKIDIDLHIDERIIANEPVQMVAGVEMGEILELDPLRPSIILRRVGTDSLWDIAKNTGSTVELIQKANGLQGDPSANQMLLIPLR